MTADGNGTDRNQSCTTATYSAGIQFRLETLEVRQDGTDYKDVSIQEAILHGNNLVCCNHEQ
jgi:hypothetical protein